MYVYLQEFLNTLPIFHVKLGVIIGWLISNTSGNQQVHFLQDESSSVILDFAWSPDSTRVAIIYSDLDQEFGSLLCKIIQITFPTFPEIIIV